MAFAAKTASEVADWLRQERFSEETAALFEGMSTCTQRKATAM